MKKAVKIIGVCLCLCFIVFVVICYLVWHDETKAVVDTIIDYINRPLPIIGLSIVALSFIIYKFLSYTTIGKKGLNKLENKQKESEEKCAIISNECEKYKEKCENALFDTNATLNAYSSEIDKLTDYLVKVCELSPNAKIKAFANEIKSGVNELKQQLQEELVNGGNQFADCIEKKDTLNEQIKAYIQQAISEANNYGENKETINDSATKE